jgi:hypothetical protein
VSRATTDWGGPTYDWRLGARFTLALDGTDFTLHNVDCSNCCWKVAIGSYPIVPSESQLLNMVEKLV